MVSYRFLESHSDMRLLSKCWENG